MEVNRLCHAPAALSPGKEPLSHWDGNQNRSVHFGDERAISPGPIIETCFPRQAHFPMSAVMDNFTAFGGQLTTFQCSVFAGRKRNNVLNSSHGGHSKLFYKISGFHHIFSQKASDIHIKLFVDNICCLASLRSRQYLAGC
jgi:hypothetical protein